MYPDHFLHRNKIRPTGVSDGEVAGQWRPVSEHEVATSVCDKGVETCTFVPDLDGNPDITCSLGNLPSLPGVTRYCPAPDPLPPTKHNGLCHGVSVQEIILSSEDLKLVNSNRRQSGITPTSPTSFVPEIVTVQERPPRYVFLLETSASMLDDDDWKWINRALQKLLRYDLPGGLEVGLVTYSHVARLEFALTELPARGEETGLRAHLADILPDQYRLLGAGGGRPCLLCGVTRALELLGPDKEGGVLVLLTRGGKVSAGERAKLLEYAEYYQIRNGGIFSENWSGKQ